MIPDRALFEMKTKKNESMVRIHILSATDRPGSNALKISRYSETFLKKKADTKIFSLKDFPLSDVIGGKYNDVPESVKKFNDRFLDADGFLFVIPEYNGGFPGILKLFHDYLPFPKAMKKAPVCLIGEAAGAFGALRPVEQYSQLLMYRQVHVFPERVFIQRVNDVFSEEEGLLKDGLRKLLEQQLDAFPDFVEKVKKGLIEA
jgi:NAD(P)H-dependent FMN reductase